MLYTVYFIWFSLLVKAHGNSDRKVNLALETVIKFDQPSLRTDVNFLDKMQSFLTKIKGAINEPDEEISRRRNQKTANDKQRHLVDYLEKAITIVLTYDDEDIKILAKILNEEIGKYHYKGCKFYELANDKLLRKVVRQLVKGLDSAPADVIRRQLTKALHGLRNTNELDKRLIDFVDSLYSKDSKQRLSKVINNLQYYKTRMRADEDDGNDKLQKMIGGAVKDLVFDHYTSLNDNARRNLKVRINAYLGDLFKHTALNPSMLRSEKNGGFADLIDLEQIGELFKFDTTTEKSSTAPKKSSTVAEKEKTILRRGELKSRVTKGLMESRTVFKDKYYEPSSQESGLRSGSGSSTETSSDSLNEKTETTTIQTKPTEKRAKPKKKKKVRTTKPAKVKRFQTKKNADAMRTIWEEVQTLSPKVLKAVDYQPKERIIFEEHNAVINIGSFRNALRDSSSEFNLRAGGVNLDVHGQENHDEKSSGSDHEGLTLEFDGKSKPHKNPSHHSARKHNYKLNFNRRASENSGDSSDSADSSEKVVNSKIKGKKKPDYKKPSDDDDDSPDSSVEIGSGGRVTAALDVDDATDWEARAKLAVAGFNENPTESTIKNKLTKISTLSLTEDGVKIIANQKKIYKSKKNVADRQPTAGSEEVQSDNNKNYFEIPKNIPGNKIISADAERAEEDFEAIKRRDNNKDNFKKDKPSSANKIASEQVTTPRNVKTSEKKERDDNSETKVTITNHPRDKSKQGELESSTSSTIASSALNLEANTKAKVKNPANTEDVTLKSTAKDEADAKTTKAETTKFNTEISHRTKENATEEFKHDEKVTEVVKELGAAGEKASRRHASAENEVGDNRLGMPWHDDEPL